VEQLGFDPRDLDEMLMIAENVDSADHSSEDDAPAFGFAE
jgi:hypothetical protein